MTIIIRTIIALYQLSSLTYSYAFSITLFRVIPFSRHSDFHIKGMNNHQALTTSVTSRLFLSSDDEASTNDIDTNKAEQIPNDLGLEIIRGGGDALSDETWREIEEGAPSKIDVMKSVSTVGFAFCILREWQYSACVDFFAMMRAILRLILMHY